MERSLSTPLYVQLGERLAAEIRSGRLGAGMKLPSARSLSKRLGITAVTVSEAFRWLRERGLAVSRVGSGTYVSGPRGVLSASSSGAFLHLDRREPPPSLFPADAVRQIMDRILEEDGGEAFAYGDAGGDSSLKEVLAAELSAGGFALGDAEVVIFSGAQQALSLLLRAWLQRGDWVLVERPTYPGMLRLLQQAGARVEAVDVGPEGPDPDRVEALLAARPFRLVYAMPAYHNPTGACWSGSCKQRVAAACSARGVLLVEDDALSGLDFGHGRARALAASVTGCSSLVYVRSFSMILMPGFRLGFCLAPRAVANTLKRAKEQADLLTSGFFQRVLCRFLAEGHMGRHLRYIETYYRDLYRRAVDAARETLGGAGFTIAPGQGGPSLWCRLPAGLPPATFFRECIRAGVGVVQGQEYSLDQSTADGMGIAFSRLHREDWIEGLRRIARAARTAAAAPSGSRI
ncbi:MAG: PLP-dependent aminotransferase family protein [Lentisphaeria bacterium]|nr:PLP-dependent aminotransferase family protein [Lentisphaeria bacterium]